MGTGHVMRCLALAQAWQSHGPVHFLSVEITPALEARLAQEGIISRALATAPGSAGDAEATIAFASESGAVWLVADGYQFGADYQQQLRNAGLRLLFFDDYGHAGDYCADLVINQNLGADAALYARRTPHTRLLLGTRYALLREEFLTWREWQREIPSVARKVLVTLGGADPDNFTSRVVEALDGLDVEARILVGGSNPHLEKLKSEIGNRKSGMELVVDSTKMPELMAWADVAVAAGGSTSWELAFMGLPSLVLVLAENQVSIAAALEGAGVSINLGTQTCVTTEKIAATLQALLTDVTRRTTMSQRGRQLVDGGGASRITTRLQSAGINLRRAGQKDCRLLWEWVNDPVVRTSAFSSKPIPWENHQKWLTEKLTGSTSAIFIARNGAGTPFGQIRFDLNQQAEAQIDVSVDAPARQGGLGSALIRAGVDEMLLTTCVQVFHALVKKENEASVRAFEKAGFRRAKLITERGQEAWHLTLARNND